MGYSVWMGQSICTLNVFMRAGLSYREGHYKSLTLRHNEGCKKKHCFTQSMAHWTCISLNNVLALSGFLLIHIQFFRKFQDFIYQHWDDCIIIPMPVKQPWLIWVKSTRNKPQWTTAIPKPCAYLFGCYFACICIHDLGHCIILYENVYAYLYGDFAWTLSLKW